MDIFSAKGTMGVGAGYAAFLLVAGLIRHLRKTGALSAAQLDALVTDAISQVPSMSNSNYDDTKALVESIRE